MESGLWKSAEAGRLAADVASSTGLTGIPGDLSWAALTAGASMVAILTVLAWMLPHRIAALPRSPARRAAGMAILSTVLILAAGAVWQPLLHHSSSAESLARFEMEKDMACGILIEEAWRRFRSHGPEHSKRIYDVLVFCGSRRVAAVTDRLWTEVKVPKEEVPRP
jgi:hypothetical protein